MQFISFTYFKYNFMKDTSITILDFYNDVFKLQIIRYWFKSKLNYIFIMLVQHL